MPYGFRASFLFICQTVNIWRSRKRIMYILSVDLHSRFVHLFRIRAMIWILCVHPIYSPVSISHLRVSLLILWNRKNSTIPGNAKMQRTTDTPSEYWWSFLVASCAFYEQKKSRRVVGNFLFLLLFFFVFNILKSPKKDFVPRWAKTVLNGLTQVCMGERYHHHLAFGTRTFAADVCCETCEDIYRRRLPPAVPIRWILLLPIYPGGQQRDFDYRRSCEKIRNAPIQQQSRPLKILRIHLSPSSQRIRAWKEKAPTIHSNKNKIPKHSKISSMKFFLRNSVGS